MNKFHNLLFVLCGLLISVACIGCTSTSHKTHIVAMWNTDETDPTFQLWNQYLADELEAQGIDAEVHHFYGHMGEWYEGSLNFQIPQFFNKLDSLGKRPDLVLAYGDFIHWNYQRQKDTLLSHIPVVYYGLKNREFNARMYEVMEIVNSVPKPSVQIFDTIHLQKSLDFAAFLENIRPLRDTQPYKPCYRFAGLIDNHSIWIDSLIRLDLIHQMHQLDSTQYLNCMEYMVPDSICKAMNAKCKPALSLNTFRDPLRSVWVQYNPVTWIFYRQRSALRFIQFKHDDISRSLTEGPNFGAYHTATGEDFLANDSCIGGHFSMGETMIRDAVATGKRLLNGEKPEQIGRQLHQPDYYVNWDLMRAKGISVEQMPAYARLYNTRFADYHPVLAIVLFWLGLFVFILLVTASVLYSVNSLRRQHQQRKVMQEQARELIFNEHLLEMAIDNTGAIMWDGAEQLRQRITLQPEWTQVVDAFFALTDAGLHQMQFRGSVDGQEEHWYDLRMVIDIQPDGTLAHSGYLLNIDKLKEIEQKAQEAHQIMVEARTREGFLAQMNHEIRTPLHAVVGLSMELARLGDLLTDEETAEFSATIKQNASALTKIINDILLVTLMKNANVAARMETCQLSALLDTKRWKMATELLQQRGNKLVVQPVTDDVTVQADPAMVAAIFENLLLNASLFSAEGSTIRVGWNRWAHGVSLWVNDEGIGIDASHQATIFEPFFKVNSFKPGCGLGLYICQQYMQKMGGTISVESELGHGSTFIIMLNR